jgi:hypothetical protein
MIYIKIGDKKGRWDTWGRRDLIVFTTQMVST